MQSDVSKTHFTKNETVAYVRDHCVRLHPVQKALIERTMTVPRSMMLGDSVQQQLLSQLVKTLGAKKTLDIGVFTGYSSLSIALALPDDGRVVACDVDDKGPAIGAKYWKEAGVDHKIDLRIAPAKDTLESLVAGGEAGTYDYAFIDADKTSYGDYYELCLKLLRPGGLIVLDNVLMGGCVVSDAIQGWNRKDVEYMRELNKKIHNDERVDVTMLSLGDGTSLIFKR